MSQLNHSLETIRQKSFFSKEFNISLAFQKNGGLNGTLTHSTNILRSPKEITGLYVVEGGVTKLSFICEWKNVNLTSHALTSYYGEIMNYNSDCQCLILRWFLISESTLPLCSYTQRDIAILIDSEGKNIDTEAREIIPQRNVNR